MSPKRSGWLHYYTEYLLASLLCLFILVSLYTFLVIYRVHQSMSILT